MGYSGPYGAKTAYENWSGVSETLMQFPTKPCWTSHTILAVNLNYTQIMRSGVLLLFKAIDFRLADNKTDQKTFS